MSINARLAKLEKQLSHKEPAIIHICRFVIETNKEPKGYLCNGLEILRAFGESLDDLQARCITAIDWPNTTDYRIFEPL